MGQVTRIDRSVAIPERRDEAPAADDRGAHFYGETAFEKKTASSGAVAGGGQRANPILVRDTAELSEKEARKIEEEIGQVGEAIKMHAPTSANIDELKKNVNKTVDSWVVQAALREFGKLKQRSQAT